MRGGEVGGGGEKEVGGRWGEEERGVYGGESWGLSMGRVSLCYSIRKVAIKEEAGDGAGRTASSFEPLELVQRANRTLHDHTSFTLSLEGGFCYLLLPFSFSLLSSESEFPRQGNLVVHSNMGGKNVEIVKKKSSFSLLQAGLWAVMEAEIYKDCGGPSKNALMDLNTGRVFAETKTLILRDGDAGYVVGVENASSEAVGVQTDLSEGFTFTRLGGMTGAVSFDVLPPRSRMLINCATVDKNSLYSGFNMGIQYVDPGMAEAMQTPRDEITGLLRTVGAPPTEEAAKAGVEPAAGNVGVETVATGAAGDAPVVGSSAPPAPSDAGEGRGAPPSTTPEAAPAPTAASPDHSSLNACYLGTREDVTAHYAVSKTPDAELVARGTVEDVTMGNVANPVGGGNAGAASSSSAGNTASSSTAGAAPATATAGHAAAATEDDEEDEDVKAALAISADPKVSVQTRVQQLFAQYVAEGMAPNDAVVKAMAEAKKQLGIK